jgi:hypothetical protein
MEQGTAQYSDQEVLTSATNGTQVQCETRGEHTTYPILALEGSIRAKSSRMISRKTPMGPCN